MGVLLYDADRIPLAAEVSDDDLVEAFMDTILDPFDPEVIAAAKSNGIEDDWIKSAQESPIYKYTKVWKIALPLHLEYRTMAMMFYIPPLSPVMSTIESGAVRLELGNEIQDLDLLDQIDTARIPIQYLANLFSVGDEKVIRDILRKMYAVRLYMRRKTVDQNVDEATLQALEKAGSSPEEAEAIYKLTTLPHLHERFVLPPYHREMSIETLNDPLSHKGETGIGYLQPPKRGE
jgi:nitrate reductase beta subunit